MCYIKSIPHFLASTVAPPVSATENTVTGERRVGAAAAHHMFDLPWDLADGGATKYFFSGTTTGLLDWTLSGPRIGRRECSPTSIWSLARSQKPPAQPIQPFSPLSPLAGSSVLSCRPTNLTLVARTAPPRCRCRQRPHRPPRARRRPCQRSSREFRGSGGWSHWGG